MTKVLALYYSSYGHVEALDTAAAEGARAAGANAVAKRVPETMPDEVAKAAHYMLDQEAEITPVDELSECDAITFGVSSRFGMMGRQLKSFLDQTGGHWMAQALAGKVASVTSSSSTQHGGQELAIVTTQALLQHRSMIIVPLPGARRMSLATFSPWLFFLMFASSPLLGGYDEPEIFPYEAPPIGPKGTDVRQSECNPQS